LDDPFVLTDTLKEGNFKPIKNELEAFNLSLLEGSLPESMDGMFIRNGPNPFKDNDPRFHWFEGWGMVSETLGRSYCTELHAVRINKGIASYKNKYVETPSYEREREDPDFHLPLFNVSVRLLSFSLLAVPSIFRKFLLSLSLTFFDFS
jgi:carotenoid cleavage dioxygenase-like enzyme